VLYTHAARRLTSKLPRAVIKYKEELWKRLQAHNITNRSNNIAAEAKLKPQNKEFEQEPNNIANTIQPSKRNDKAICD
jgi:hypothetical protein